MILYNPEWEDKIEINLYIKCYPHKNLLFFLVCVLVEEGDFQIYLKSNPWDIGTGIGKEVSDTNYGSG